MALTWIVVSPFFLFAYFWQQHRVSEWQRKINEELSLQCPWSLSAPFEEEVTRVVRRSSIFDT